MILSEKDPGFRRCALTVMDNIADPDIQFDDKGVCNYYHEYQQAAAKGVFTGKDGEDQLNKLAEKIKKEGKNKQYDCLIGLSGGVDSTYVAWLVKQLGLRPLAVHLDNGWNSELAVANIEKTLRKLGIDLYTHVIDWEEFRDLQISFLRSSTPDAEVPTDHAILAL